MTISTLIRKTVPVVGNGSTTALPFGFKVFSASDISVIRTTIATGAGQTLTLGSDYTVSLNANQDANPGGTVTLTSPLATGTTAIIVSAIPETQPAEVQNAGGFLPAVLNPALDRAIALLQQISERLGRTPALPVNDTTSWPELPPPAQRQNTVIVFDGTGTPTVVPRSEFAGPPGPAGPTGPAGPAGPTGPSGTNNAGDALPLVGGVMTGDIVMDAGNTGGIQFRRASDDAVQGRIGRNTDAMLLTSLGAGIPLQLGTTGVPRFTLQPNGTAGWVPLSGAPASPAEGQAYYDSTLKAVRYWNGSEWRTVTSSGSGALDPLTLSPVTAGAVTSSSIEVSVQITGSIPSGAKSLLQITSSLSGGSWLESARPTAVAGTFSHTFTGLTAGTTYYARAFVFQDNGGVGDVIYAQSANTAINTLSGTTGVTTLAQAYATAMSSLNDFPPGNAAGDTNWVASTWPRDSVFTASPYGSNMDPLRFGQNEPGIGMTDAGYIVTRRGASSRISDRFSLWQWFMSPKGVLNVDGNWRVQIRDVQAALKIDSLSSAWVSKFSGQVRTYGSNGANPLAISGNVADYTDNNRILLFSSTNVVDGRIEASGGISFKNFTLDQTQYQVETNANDPLVMLTASETPSRVVAFAAVYWARIIPNTGPGPIPTGLRIGAIHGVDFYDGTGRVGTPGQGRLVELDATWRPVVCAFVLSSAPPSTPMTPSETSAWLAANPPPFS